MLIDNIGQDIELELLGPNSNSNNDIFIGLLRGYIKGLPFKDGDILTIHNKNGKYNLVGVNGKKIIIDMENSVANNIIFHYVRS